MNHKLIKYLAIYSHQITFTSFPTIWGSI